MEEDELQLNVVFLLFMEILITSTVVVSLGYFLEKKLNYHASVLRLVLCHFFPGFFLFCFFGL